MTVLTARPYSSTTDLQPIVNLLTLCASIDQEDRFYSVANLQLNFTEPGFDPIQNVRLWEDARGNLIACASIWTPTQPIDAIRAHLGFSVHPGQRWQGIEMEILAWAESRLRTLAATHNLPATLFLHCREHQVEQIAFYQQFGYRYQRCFLTMERSLTEAIDPVQLPQGFQILEARSLNDAAAWVEMYNQTFIDHWNFHAYTVEEYSYDIATTKYCPELDLIAVAPDGTFSAFCWGNIDAEQNQQQQRREGWIDRLGTRRGFRRMGLARAILLSGLQRLQAAGMETAKLGVDTQNPNQAQSLYESVGFRQLYASLTYAKSIEKLNV